MPMRPVGPYLRVLVRRDPDPETESGIIVPTKHRKHSVYGTVVSTMPDGIRTSRNAVQQSDLKPGDRVLFGQYSGSDITVDYEQLTIMPESEILAVVE